MIVCICRRMSDRDIEREVRDGCASFEALQDQLLVATACGACADCARKTFDCQREKTRNVRMGGSFGSADGARTYANAAA
jgi:bacterioferritin-associated ferredoxin